jgi:Domain of unknown function (DUF222)
MGVTSTFERLEAMCVASLGTGELAAATGDITRVRGFLDDLEAQITRRATELHDAGSGVPPEDLLARGGRTSRKQAARTKKRAVVLGNTPRMGEMLAKGKISPEHADALATTADRVGDSHHHELFTHDQELAEAAAAKTPEQFRRYLDRLANSISDDADLEHSERQRAAATLSMGIDETTGMHWLRGQFHPEHGHRIRRLLDGMTDKIAKRPEHVGARRDQIAALALFELVESPKSSRPRNNVDLAVHIDLPTLQSGRHPDTICELSDASPIAVATARRLACDANIIPIVLGGDGMPLDVGRSQRLATPEQRAALRAMYRTCGIGDCDVSFDRCEIHHLIEWDNAHGPTDLTNLIPACGHHHHRAHEGRWQLQLRTHDRQLTVWLPDGTLHSQSFPDIIDERTERNRRPAA